MKYKAAAMIIGVIVLTVSAASGACQTASHKERYAWPLATASPEDTVTQIYAETFAKEVDKLSNGTMHIQVYPNSTLGGDRELLESCRDGDIPFVVQNTAPQVSFMPDTAVFDLPCTFDTMEEARAKVDSAQFSKLMEGVYEDAGYRLLGYADQGFRVMSTNKKIEQIEDFQGQKIRTMENTFHMDFWKVLKANPTPMSFSEVYIGLQQHTIDAQENPYEVIVSNKLYEQQKYVVETNHLPHMISLFMSEEFYEGLDKEEQKVIKEAAEIAKLYARKQSDERIGMKVRQIEESGTKIIKPTDSLVQEIKEASKPVRSKIQNYVSKDVYKAYVE